jgi:hypothetical protein
MVSIRDSVISPHPLVATGRISERGSGVRGQERPFATGQGAEGRLRVNRVAALMRYGSYGPKADQAGFPFGSVRKTYLALCKLLGQRRLGL